MDALNKWTVRDEMGIHTTIGAYFGTLAYCVASALFLFFQEVLHKSQIDIPAKYLLIFAVVLAFLGGYVSYVIQLKQLKEMFNKMDAVNNMVIALAIALLVGLFSAGYMSDTFWLGTVLGSAIFKNVIIAVIPEVIQTRVADFLHTNSKRLSLTETASKEN